jgi:hypothetical protein
MPTDLTDALLGRLQRERELLVGTLDGLSEYDVRRPMTPSGTSLLGLVKHVASVELGYLGDSVGRPHGIELTWTEEEAFEGADMWATATESREWLIGVYRQSWAHADESVRAVGLDASATVSWWSEDDSNTTVGHLVVRMVAETAHHAGHAEAVRRAILRG